MFAFILIRLLEMKKSLALKLETDGSTQPKRKLLTKAPEGGGTNGEKPVKTSLKLNIGLKAKQGSEKSEKAKADEGIAFRGKGLSLLPASILNTISSLKSLDISSNKLSDSQLQLLFNSCPKIQTLCIEDNVSTLIPASLWKLKNLENFRHDWVLIFHQATYEPSANLKSLMEAVRKPNLVNKHSGVLGMTFESYCQNIMKIQVNESLEKKVKNSQCSSFAQGIALDVIRTYLKNDKEEETDIEIIESSKRDAPVMPGCFNMLSFETQTKHKVKGLPWNDSNLKNEQKMSDVSFDESLKKIKIENVRDIKETQGTQASTNQMSFPDMVYQHKDMPLHMLFSKYDKNPHGAIDIDRLLLKGYNPNTYDHNGLSAYHIIIIFKQQKALERLIQISFKNPGFFDLEMPSMKEGRNILHFSVFVKDYHFTKTLIDFGLPIDKRDFNGARLVHLVDQNYQFLLLLRKAIKRKYKSMKTPSFFTYPEPLARKYCRHPPRMAQQANYQTFENKNLNLMQMYEAAVSSRGSRN